MAYGNMNKAVAGLIDGLHHDIESRLVAGSTGDKLDFGKAAFAASTPDGESAAKTGSVVIGITTRTAKVGEGYDVGDCANVMTRGRVWAVAGGAITADSAVKVSSAGKVVASSTASSIAFPGHAVAKTAAAADGDLVLVEIG